jgi:hypothetical protein
MKNISVILFISFLFSSASLYSQNALDLIINDMTLAHEGLPHGVPEEYTWYKGPRVGTPQPPAGWTAAVAWGQVYEWIEGNPAINTRVQIKDMEMYILKKSDALWHLLQESKRVFGEAYVEDYVNNISRPADIRQEADSSISVTCGDGYTFHFWPEQGRTAFPENDVAGCFVTVQARLILDDPQGIDDRDSARYLLNVGGDWWLNLDAEWNQWTTNTDMGIGRFRFVTSEWTSFNMITLDEQQIRDNPPPFHQQPTRVANHSEANNDLLFQVYPNPFNAVTILSYTLPIQERVTVELFTMRGQKIRTVYNQIQSAGQHLLSLDAGGMATGIYLCRIWAGNIASTKKCILIR